MAVKKKTPPVYEDERDYDVKLSRPVTIGGSKLLPLPVHDMTGAFLKRIIEQEGDDVVDRAEPR